MNRDELLNRLCALVTNVGTQVFNSDYSHDCFCPSGEALRGGPTFMRVDEEVIAFIESAINEKIVREKIGG